MRAPSKYQSNISWPDVVFLAEAEREPFTDVQFITLYAHCLNLSEQTNAPLNKIEQAEQVRIYEDRVVVIINVDTIDDEAIARGLDLLTHVDDFQVGGKHEFGPKRSFTYNHLH